VEDGMRRGEERKEEPRRRGGAGKKG